MNDEKKKIGLIGAIAIVAGNMMGSGISLLPANLAAIGSITLISWLITFVGAIALAYIFAKLGVTHPQEGGPVAYAGQVTPIFGYQTGILYWLANWVGNLAIAMTGVEYLSIFYQPLLDPIIGGLATIAFVWIFTIINYFGADKVAKIVSVTIILLLIPVIGTAILGWFHFSPQLFLDNWNVSQTSSEKAIFSGIVLVIWSFIGVESASVSAGVVTNPKRTIPLATMIGTAIAAIAYIASSTAISGMFPASVMAKSGAPFSLAFGNILGAWVKPYVSIFTAVACLASLGSWMMLVGQAGMVAARDNTLPKIFGRQSKNGMPVIGLTINSILMTLVMIVLIIISYNAHQSANALFGDIISIAVLLTILPYFYSCLYFLKVHDVATKRLIPFVVAIIACVFCFTALIGAEGIELSSAITVSFICFIFYALKTHKSNPVKEVR